ncbi:MAG: type II toxin-antitoxin system VapC family toxin [Planctomycetes bacterium]|nr:type II toxin-antitoxin system VapC family toxin [Planctomycetota bacterium]
MIRRQPARLVNHLKSHRIGSVGISSITLAELRYGVEQSAQPAQNLVALTKVVAPLVVAYFDARAAEEYGRVRSDLERRGQTIGPLDTLIAAHALSLGSILVTNNEREFRRVKGLRVKNWLVS